MTLEKADSRPKMQPVEETVHVPHQQPHHQLDHNSSSKKHKDKKTDEFEPNPNGAINAAADLRKMRRIIAEDPDWSLAIVPLLADIVVTHITNNFHNNPSILKHLPEKSRTKVLRNISTDLPLKLIVNLIDEEDYWKRRCKSKWKVCNVTSYDNNWKQMYCERNLEEMIENFIPNKTDPKELFEVLSLSSCYIRRVKIKQLLPPIKEKGLMGENVSDYDGSESGDEPKIDHFDFGSILPRLTNLTEFRLTYGVTNCGMNFEWHLFHFTARDCLLLAQCIIKCTQLKVFALNKSNVDDDRIRVIIAHILDHPQLIHLDLAHNKINDRGARAIGKFINDRSKLETLNLCDNDIGGLGGETIAFALRKNKTLKELNLRLNRLGDDGGQAICQAMSVNNTLKILNLAANDLSERTAEVLSQVLRQNTSMEKINLACNSFDSDGGKLLQEGLDKNFTVTDVDLRITDCDQESIYCIGQTLNRNREKKKLT